MTVQMMRQWGVVVKAEVSMGSRCYLVPAPQRYGGRQYQVEPDATAASYFLAAAVLTGGHVIIRNLGSDSLQGDVAFASILEQMGARVRLDRGSVSVEGTNPLAGVDVDMNAVSDTVMTLAVLAPFASSPTRIRNVAHIRHKECDRIAATCTELQRLGVWADEHEDGMTIYPSAVHGGRVRTYNDHRMAMAFGLIGLRVPGVLIENPSCVTKTFPRYFEELARLCSSNG